MATKLKSTIVQEKLEDSKSKYDAKKAELDAFVEKNDKDDFTPKQKKDFWDKFNQMDADLKSLQSEINQLQTDYQNELKLDARRNEQRKRDKAGHRAPEEKIASQFSWIKFINACNPKNSAAKLEGVELELAQQGAADFKSSGQTGEGTQLPGFLMNIPKYYNENGRMVKDLSVGTATSGGHSVATDLLDLIPFLDVDPIISRLGADVLPGLSGNIDFPREDSLGVATWEGELDPTAAADGTLDKLSMVPKRLGAHVVMSNQLLRQTSIAIESRTRFRLGKAKSDALDIAAMNGAGTGNIPEGVLNATGIGDVDHGTNGGAESWAKIVSYAKTLAGANALKGNLAWTMTPEAKYELMNLEKATGTAKFILEEPGDTLLGYPIIASNNMPSNLTKGTGTGLHSAIFANWQELILAQWGDALDVLVDPYSFSRNAQTQIVINTWWNVALKHVASFVAGQDISIT